MRLYLRRTVIGLLIALTLVFVCLGAFLYYLTTPSGSAKLAILGEEWIEKNYGLKIEHTGFHFSPFKGFEILGLSIQHASNPSNAPVLTELNLKAERLAASYKIAFLKRSLTISDLHVKNAHLSFRTQSSPPLDQAKPPANDQDESLRNLLANPPVQLEVKKLRVENSSVSLNQEAPAASKSLPTSSISLKEIEIDAAFKLLPNQFETAGEFSFRASDPLKWHQPTAPQSQSQSRMQALVSGKGGWQAALKIDQTKWIYLLKVRDLQFTVSDLEALQTSAGVAEKPVEKTEIKLRNLGSHLAIDFNAESDEFLKIVKESIREWKLAGKIDLTQLTAQSGEKRLSTPHVQIDLKSYLQEQAGLGIKAEVVARKVSVPNLSAATSEVSSNLEMSLDADLQGLKLNLGARLDKKEILKTNFMVRQSDNAKIGVDRIENWDVTGRATFQYPDFGAWNFEPTVKVETSAEAVSANLNFKLSQIKVPRLAPYNLILFKEPVTALMRVKSNSEGLRAEGGIRSKHLQMREPQLRIRDLALDFAVLQEPNESIVLDRLTLTSRGDDLRLEGQGSFDPKSLSAQAQGRFAIDLSSELSAIAQQKMSGRLSLPWTISLLQGRDVTLTGALEMKNINWEKPPYAFSSLNGRIPFSESLVLSDGSISFSQVINQNPFERVDFERVRPLLAASDQLRIEEIRWEEKRLGPLVGFFSVRQNVLYGHQFEADFGSGRTYGEIFFNAHPSILQLGTLIRASGVELDQVLPSTYLRNLGGKSRNLNARSGLVFDLRRNTIDGRLDISEIGGPQLIALINVLDPTFEDEKLNQARTVLQIGSPTSVNLVFAEGYMNLDMNIRALGLNQAFQVRGIPVSNLMAKATEGLIEQVEKGPLQ